MSSLATRPAALIDVLTGEGVEVSLTGCVVVDPNISFERLEQMLRAAGATKRALSFVIGDLILYTEGAFGESYAQAADATGLSPETLMNYVSVCRRVARSRRRAHYDYCPRSGDETQECGCPGVPFGVHSEIAVLEPDDQARWLDRVCATAMTRAELRAELLAERALNPGAEPPLPPSQLWTSTGGRHAPPPLTEETIDRAETRARGLLEEPPSDGSPAWQMQAEEQAREVLTLAPAARGALPDRLLERTQLGLLLDAVGRLIRAAEADEADTVLVRVPRAILTELADLSASDED